VGQRRNTVLAAILEGGVSACVVPQGRVRLRRAEADAVNVQLWHGLLIKIAGSHETLEASDLLIGNPWVTARPRCRRVA
jgi:hypothetical protein